MVEDVVSDGLRELVEDRVDVPEGVSAADCVEVLELDPVEVVVLEAEIVADLEDVDVCFAEVVPSADVEGDRVAVSEADRVLAALPDILEERVEDTDGLVVLELVIVPVADGLFVDVLVEDNVAVPDLDVVGVRELVEEADVVRLDVALLLFEPDPVAVLEDVDVLEVDGEPDADRV